ncbi:uncharacterized protein DEA37_0004889 [Paragonimus westermani]|uniref:Uncharacterized protein n=1 Tax=Paragonimus westermani TaxID=34504 RepID=A0A5J4NRR0_9TREM|nr:uncharacterized protein DEA37_0004889 [Paragonimus westermani]
MLIVTLRANVVVLVLSTACLIAALATSGWSCGNLFEHCMSDRDEMKVIVSLLVGGSALVAIVLLMDLIALCTTEVTLRSGYTAARQVLLLIGVGALLSAVIFYTVQYNRREWSYFLAVSGTMLAVQIGLFSLLSCESASCSC